MDESWIEAGRSCSCQIFLSPLVLAFGYVVAVGNVGFPFDVVEAATGHHQSALGQIYSFRRLILVRPGLLNHGASSLFSTAIRRR